MTEDPFNLTRFVSAQDRVYGSVLHELRNGRKMSHWMWFVFPQLKGLGRTSTSDLYGIGSFDEARAYLQHPSLGARLRECVQLALSHRNKTAGEIFGFPDDLKFCSSMTLFALAAESEPIFEQALEQFCGGEKDALTLRLLGR